MKSAENGRKLCMKTRAERRHQVQRTKQRVRSYWVCADGVPPVGQRKIIQSKHVIGLVAHTKARCSCWMCGNPRKWWKEKTMQEKRFDESVAVDDNNA